MALPSPSWPQQPEAPLPVLLTSTEALLIASSTVREVLVGLLLAPLCPLCICNIVQKPPRRPSSPAARLSPD